VKGAVQAIFNVGTAGNAICLITAASGALLSYGLTRVLNRYLQHGASFHSR
jgi:hypothetical protein